MAISYTGIATVSGQSVVSVTTTGRTTSSGCVLVAVASYYAAAGAALTLTDSKSNTWVAAAPNYGYHTSTARRMGYWYCIPSSTGASHTFTATRGDSNYTSIVLSVYEIAGADTTTPIDTATAAQSKGTSTTPSNTTGTLSQANELIIGMTAWGTAATATEDGAFTNRVNTSSGGDLVKLYSGTKIVSATSAVTYAPTLSASADWGAHAIAVKEAAAGATTSLAMLRSGSRFIAQMVR